MGTTFWSFDGDHSPESYGEEITNYQKELIDRGVVGKMSYQELLEMSKQGGPTLHIWTESPCLMKKLRKEPKEPKSYKNEPVLNDLDFTNRYLDNQARKDFYTQHGKDIRNLNREESLRILDEWTQNRSSAQRV